MSFKRNKLRDAITFALVVGSAGAFGTAFAQDTAPAAETPSELDTIVVTGTRIQSQTVTASSPVVEIQPEEFQYAGATRVDDLVNQYPQMSPYFDSFANNPSTGYPTIDLRGLGPERTLTLVNGNRLAPGALEVRDISMIPASLVKRVDILTGGASAVYGSDAIAGVVNFILNTEFEGVSVTAGISAYQHNNDNEYMQEQLDARDFPYPEGNSGFDGVSKNIDLAVGSSFADGAGHAMAWLTWRQNDALFQGERDYSSCALSASGVPQAPGAPGAFACGGSATNATGNFYIYQVLPDGPDAGTAPDIDGESASLNPDGSWNDAYGQPYNYAPINYYQRPDERYTFGASLKYEINEHFRPYLEMMYVNKRDALQIAESGAFFTFIEGECDNPLFGTMCEDLGFDPELPLGIYVAKRNVEGGPRLQNTENNSYRFVAGLEGAINDNWSYNTSFLYGHTRQETQGYNDFLTDRIAQALLGCEDGAFTGCLLYNVWEPNAVTPESAAALSGVAFFSTETELKSFNSYVTGDIGWAFPWAQDENVSVVFGGEWREESYAFTADSHSQAGNFAGSGGPSVPVSGTTKVAEMFMEAQLPIYKGDGLLRALAFDVGYRLSDYNLSGKADTYKLGFTSDFGMVRARGGFNHAIRAPSTTDLFAPQQIALFAGADPCAGASPTFTEAECANTGVLPGQYGTITQNPAQQNNQFIGGNPNLTPEAADTWTLGFVATPIDGLTLSLDYYDIFLENTIDTIGATTIINVCAETGNALICDRINRNAAFGDLWRGSDPATAGHVVNLTDNIGEQTFRGIDLGANYRWEMLGGRFGASFQGTYLLEQEYNPLPGIAEEAKYDCVGRINTDCQQPEWRHIANVRYSRDWFTVNLRWRYMGEMSYEDADGDPLFTDRLLCDEEDRLAAGGATTGTGSTPCRGDGKLEGWNYFDVSGSAFIGKNTEVTVGVNNIADKEPPLVGVNEALNGNSPGGYDQAGRYFFASVTFKW